MANLCEIPLRDLPPATPLTLGLWTTASQAARTLLEAGAGEALVLDAGRPLGVVTTRGLVRVLVRDQAKAAHLAVRDLMDAVAVSPDTDPLPAALRHMLAGPSRRLAVVDAKGRAVGILAPFHVARLCHELDALAGRTVASAMARAVVTASLGEPLLAVLARMVRTGVGGVVVTETDQPRGMFTARDVASLLADGRDIRGLAVDTVMRAPVVAVSPQLPLAEAVSGMDGAGAGRLAVTDAAGYLLGLLTWTDVAKALSQVLCELEGGRLRERADFFHDLYDNAFQGLFRLDTAGHPLAANKTLARLLGYRDVADFLRQAKSSGHPLRLDTPERRNLLVHALGQKEPVFFETHFFRHDGSVSRLNCMMRSVHDARGYPVALEGACADFSVLPPAMAPVLPETGYRSFVEHVTDLICLLDAAQRLVFVNAAFARYWGKSPEVCVEEDFQPEIPEDDAAVRNKRLGALTPDRPTTGFEHRVLRADGRVRWQRWTYRAIFDDQGVVVEYQAVGRDVTARKLAEKRLREQCILSRSMIESLPVATFFKTLDGRYAGCNRAFEVLSGIARGQLIGKTLFAFLDSGEAETYASLDAELATKGGRMVYEALLPTPAGRRNLMLHKSLVCPGEGKGDVAGIIGVAIDITERRQAEAAATQMRDGLEGELQKTTRRLSEETSHRQQIEIQSHQNARFLETLLDATQDGVCVLTPDLTMRLANRVLKALRAGNGDLIGRKCYDACHDLAAPCPDCPALRAMATRKLAMSVVPCMDNGNQTGWVELFCYPLFDASGNVTAVMEIVRDVTAGRKLEAELAAALERAEAASQAKGAFLANMSHEIRTPLNAVLGYVQLMLGDRLDSRQRERLTVVEESAGTLLSIINDILDYSKIEAGRMELKDEAFDLSRCLEAVLKEQEVLARDKGLELSLTLAPGLPQAIRGDGLRLRQVLRNLVNNAVKYTEKGRVRLSVSPVEAGSGAVCLPPGRALLRFAVTDTGCGIPVEQQSAIFDSFTQVDGSLTKKQAGTGLGLAICRRLAELMGGSLVLRSVPGQGSTFSLECPFEVAVPASASVAAALPDRTVEGLPRLRILLVEDNRVNRIFAADLLESRGHEVVTAENGQAALEYLASHPVDVVLMDIQMPVMDGLTATRAIRAGQNHIDPGLPVLGLSAYAMDQERERFLAAGLDDYIIKPIDLEAFFTTVRRVLARRGRPLLLSGVAEAASPPVLDTQGLCRQYRNKTRLLSRVGREFVSSVPEQLKAMESALAGGDMQVCERVAHTLKGNAAMFGAAAMRALAAEAEIAASKGDAGKIASLAPALSQACQAVVAGLDDFLRRMED